MVAAAFLNTIPPRFIGAIVDDVTHQAPFSSIALLAGGMVLVAVVATSMRGFGRYHVIDQSRLLEYEIRNDLLGHLQRMDLGYYQRSRIGDLMARMTNDLTAVRQMYG